MCQTVNKLPFTQISPFLAQHQPYIILIKKSKKIDYYKQLIFLREFLKESILGRISGKFNIY